MKKIFAIITILAFAASCQKSNNGNEDVINQGQDNFILNNVKIDASTVRNWLADRNLDRIVLTFHTADLRSISSNLTLTAFVYKNSSEVPVEAGVTLEIVSPSTLGMEANLIFANNSINSNAIRTAVTDASGMIEFDYLLLQPKYYHHDGKTYLTYSIKAIKDGAPAKLTTDDDCQASNPCPPFQPGDCPPE